LVTTLASSISQKSGFEIEFDATFSVLQKVALQWSEPELSSFLDRIIEFGNCDKTVVSVLASTLVVIVLEIEEIKVSSIKTPNHPIHLEGMRRNHALLYNWYIEIEKSSTKILDLTCHLLRCRDFRQVHIGVVLYRILSRHEKNAAQATLFLRRSDEQEATASIKDRRKKADISKVIPDLVVVPSRLTDGTCQSEPSQRVQMVPNIPTKPHGWPGDGLRVDWDIVDNYLMFQPESKVEENLVNTLNLIRFLAEDCSYSKKIISTDPGGGVLLKWIESQFDTHAADRPEAPPLPIQIGAALHCWGLL
jgi:hypothetical protein